MSSIGNLGANGFYATLLRPEKRQELPPSGLLEVEGSNHTTATDEIALEKPKAPARSRSEISRDEFLNYAKLSAGEKLFIAWLERKGMTKEKFDALPPEEKQKLLVEFQENLKREAKNKIEKGALVNALA